ncbi:MAG: class II aldolase/adducin family protein [Armatimonadota bacterium]|nr:class II aldolase/adducin family protein [Armatimonadota bacterium]MDW8157094.1 class II aldolase/adducin family protein [Armatimonadota bacterium]
MAAVTDSADLERLRRKVAAVSRRAYRLGLAPGISGNVSCRVPGQDRVLIKATGLSLGQLTRQHVLLMDLDGNVVEPSELRPSKERFFHLEVYRRRPDVGAVVHLHPPCALVFAAAHRLPPLRTGAARTFLGGRIALVPPAPSGSRELAEAVGQALGSPGMRAAILAEHGTVTVGADLEEALYVSEYLEDACRTALWLRVLEGEG